MAPAGQPAAAAARQPAGPPGALPLRWALPAAAAGGLALAGAFPPVGVWPLAFAGPAVLALTLYRQRFRASFGIGLVFGVAFFVPLLSWLINVAWYAWAALAIAEAVIFGLLCIGQRLLLRLPGWPVAVACWWVAAEAMRARWPYAFPWGRLAMSQSGSPTAHWAAIGGPPLLSFLVALAGATLAWAVLAVLARRARPRGLIPAGLAVAGAFALALGGALLPVDQAAPGERSAVVAAIQGDVPHARSIPDLLRATTVTQNHAAATEALAAQVAAGARPAPDLVIWPENSTDLDPSLYPPIYATIASAVRTIDRPVLVGALLENPLRNTGQLWLPGHGPVATYVKRKLVPFGESIPFRSLLKHITSLVNLQPVNFTAGDKAVVFHRGLGAIRLGDVICYEVGFDGLVRSEVTAGANLLAVQSNDATFEVDGQSGESTQQVAMARIQAITSNRAVVYASTTGESAIVSPAGAVLARSGLWQRAELEARVPLRTGLTLADRLGGWPEAVLTGLAIAALALATGLTVRDRRAGQRSTALAGGESAAPAGESAAPAGGGTAHN